MHLRGDPPRFTGAISSQLCQPATTDGFFYRAFDGVLHSCPANVFLPLSHVDVDTDSNNNGALEQTPQEDAIEMLSPGKVIGYNKDDDNGNGVADYQDTSIVVGGDWDLYPLCA